MAILPLRRINVVGPLADKRDALDQLQELGCVHLIIASPPGDDEQPPTDEGAYARDALRFLEDCQARRHQAWPTVEFDMPKIVARTLAVRQQLRQHEDRREFLVDRIGFLSRWGNFQLPPVDDIAGCRLWFYDVPLYQMDRVRQSDLIWHEVNRDNRHAYVVVISRDEPDVTAMPVPRTHTGSVSLHDLTNEVHELELQIEDLHAERASLTRWADRLRDNLQAAEDRAELAHALDRTWSEHDLFVIQGWAPQSAIARIRAFTDAAGLVLTERAPTSRDAPPTLLDNPEKIAGGQEIVSFWQLPGYSDFDPSPIIATSFALFFAMIMSDAGYALVLAVMLALSWRWLGGSRAGQRIQSLALLIVGMAVVYGVMVGSYFGYNPQPGTVIARLQLLDVQNYPQMMRLAIVVGAAHLALGNALAAWQGRARHTAVGRLGWAVAIAGGLALWLGWERDPDGPVVSAGILALAAGLVAVLLFSGEQRIRDAGDVLKRALQGALALTSVTKAFGDVLSYLRLFALGLASASLAMTFNELAAQIRGGAGAAGPYLAVGLLLLGHALNFALILMSAVVHGLRLNLIEFYNWSVTEEGYPFRAFRKRSGR
jgi:V/A-type H+-transporting ATPase subunit I